MDKVSPTDSSVDPMEGCIGLKSPGDSHDSDIYSPENAGFMPTLEGIPTFTCSCFKQSLGDLANMLMVIIVIIDSLLTTLDVTATSTKGPVQDGMPVMSIQNGGKISKNMGAGFKSHIDACPLLVGGFPVPSEEKTCFVRQILQTRLSMLLLTVRRIRACMEQDLAAAISRGRMLMIMETDRRLQLIMMKIKMAVG
ncbi:hypothetical protein N7462_000843 [Penicillium macrosclerotiorum]|uniref:uncharacterized protein n=1 Tax=Penicillium macrosclerotiorum TaxID=303699 RepID=UPI002547AE56|nr:uncharacterized protein N7462_000843 [Penicillium macrosclerotiorum]KAJ5698838.1 hypothetical protein N7462_000843 [Penicillium macrosclerotiorum]